MPNSDVNYKIGLVVCAIFGSFLLASLSQLVEIHEIYSGIFSYNEVWISAIIIVAMIYSVRHKELFNNKYGQVFAYSVVGLYALYDVMLILESLDVFSLDSVFGNLHYLPFSLLISIALVGFLFSTKAWLPIKIFGASRMLIFNLLYINEYRFFELRLDGYRYQEEITELSDLIDIYSNLTLLFALLTVAMAILPMSKRLYSKI